MNRDLEETLCELGPEYRSVVNRLRSAPELEVRRNAVLPPLRRIGILPHPRLSLLAASLFIVLSLSVWFLSCPSTSRHHSSTLNLQPSASGQYGAREYRMSTAEIIATQRADGSWANDFLTRHNADALKHCNDPRARIAYKKALRNLRLRQML